MAKKPNRTVVLVMGWGLLALGVAGLVLPILPGAVLLLAGVSVLSTEYVWAHKLLQRLRDHFPVASRRLRAAERWARKRLYRVLRRKSQHPEN